MTFKARCRKALQLSLNVPAIALLDRVRRQPAVVAAEAGRRQSGTAKDVAPGLGWVSAASASRCEDLTQLYAGLARARQHKAVAEIMTERHVARDSLRLMTRSRPGRSATS